MDQRIIDLYDEYTHRPLDRRVFLDRLAVLTGGPAAATFMLSMLESDYARAQAGSGGGAPAGEGPAGKSAGAEPVLGVVAERVSAPGATGPIASLLARPAEGEKFPAVIVIHENRGLNPHIEDVARRVARAGFLALAPDLLSPLGGTPADEDEAREKIGRLDPAKTVGDLRKIVAWLAADPRSTGKVGAVGFCWGGGMVNRLAVAEPDLDAGVVFYGSSPEPADVPKIQAPLLLHYAGLDQRINATVPAYEDALKKARKTYTLHMYEGVNHAFHNDTSAARYDAGAARLAWERTIAFLREHLG